MMDDDNTTPPAERPEYDRLLGELRVLGRRQDEVAKAERQRLTATLIMRQVSELFEQGKISGADLAKLHALRLRLDPTGGW